MTTVVMSAAVRDAINASAPVVALESTVYSNLGLPSPDNRAALERSLRSIAEIGAIPAVTAIVDGSVRAGLEDDELELVLTATQKTAERDLPIAVAERWAVGATTVSASLAIAAAAGIDVFATGGIGGVHRDAAASGDISVDLDAIARHRVATVSAGAKSFLDLPLTLEHLETLGVPVIGWQTDTFPAFTAVSSGLPVPHRVDDLETLADAVRCQLGFGRGLLVVSPVPQESALDQDVHDRALENALSAAQSSGVSGAAVTPFVLDRIAAATSGASVPANLALVENNASLAARLAVQLHWKPGKFCGLEP